MLTETTGVQYHCSVCLLTAGYEAMTSQLSNHSLLGITQFRSLAKSPCFCFCHYKTTNSLIFQHFYSFVIILSNHQAPFTTGSPEMISVLLLYLLYFVHKALNTIKITRPKRRRYFHCFVTKILPWQGKQSISLNFSYCHAI